MTASLCFNEFTFSPVTRNNEPWFKSSEIASALGYKREDTLSRLFDRNVNEFTEKMTQLIEISTDRQNGVMGNFGTGRARIFSLRGCHLLAMFARTPVAKAFRRWVLDVIEQYGDRVPVERPVTINDELISAAERAELKLIVDAKLSTYPAAVQGKARAEIWAKHNRHFSIAEYSQLPARLMPDAREFLLAVRVRAINAIPTAEAALPPAAPRFDEAAMLELAAEIREAQQQYYRTFGRLCSRLISMSIPVFTALESRVYKQAPDRPFSGVRIGAQWERYFTERMTAALHSLDDRLPDEKNPAMLLLEYARAMSAR